jgi:propionyl-CoA carboxylase alpha chain
MRLRRYRCRGEELELSTGVEGDVVSVAIDDGEPTEFTARRIGERDWRLAGPDPTAPAHRVTAVRDGLTWWIHADGRTWCIERVTEAGDAAGSSAGSLTAPIPATVVEVLVEVGEQVARDDVLMVLAAMKMQFEVTAPEPGVVAELPYGPGEQVDGGVVLAVVRPLDEGG